LNPSDSNVRLPLSLRFSFVAKVTFLLLGVSAAAAQESIQDRAVSAAAARSSLPALNRSSPRRYAIVEGGLKQRDAENPLLKENRI
jgi:hypothetical protein